jgi:hypothetical protein
MNAVDLTWDQKRKVLGRVRAQLGAAQYDALEAQVGEDAILAQVLLISRAAASRPAPTPAPERRGMPEWLGLLLVIGCVVAGFAGMSYAKGGPLGIFCGIVSGGLAGFGWSFSQSQSLTGAVFGCLGGLIGGGIAGAKSGDSEAWWGFVIGGMFLGCAIDWIRIWAQNNMPRF